MNATFTNAPAAVRWMKSYEARGFTVEWQVRGKTIFVSAYRAKAGSRAA